MNIIDLSNKSILITGSGSGIGREIAIVASRLGARVNMLDLSEEGLQNTSNALMGSGHSSHIIDLADFSAIGCMIENIVANQGPLCGLVHCAGISSRKPLNVLKREGFSNVMDVNFFAFVELVKQVTKKGRFIDGGSIVVMSSISSIRGFKAKTEYCVSKAAVDAFVRCMALELAPKRIRINSIMPGEVLTPMGAKSREMAKLAGFAIEEAPLGPTHPEEIANLIAFLLSDATKTITGTSIRIDGGMSV